MIHFSQGSWKKSQNAFESACREIPEAKVKLGHVHLLQGEPEKALNHYMEIDRPSHSPFYLDAMVGRGCAHLELMDLRKAAIAFESAHKFHPESTANNLLGWLIYRFPQVCFSAITLSRQIYAESSAHPLLLETIAKQDRAPNILSRQSATKELQFAQELLNSVAEIKDSKLRMIFTAEILTKIVAFNSYPKGSKLLLPIGSKHVRYTLGSLILKDGIPVTTLIPDENCNPSILLFRGTALGFTQPGSYASICNNFDPNGVARQFFDDSKTEIEKWLKTQGRGRTQIMGYSQGGALTTMSVATFSSYVSHDPAFPSLTFNPPATDVETVHVWQEVIKKGTPPVLQQYLVQGDLVSRLGYEWIGELFQIEFNQLGIGINAHFLLTCAQPDWRCRRVDTRKDNLALSRKVLSILPASTLGNKAFELFTESLFANGIKLLNSVVTSSSLNFSDVIRYAKPFMPFLGAGAKYIVFKGIDRFGRIDFEKK